MTNQETKVANWFSTELSSSVSNSTLTFPVDSIGSLTSPAYIIIDPDNAAKREVVLADGTWGASSFVASSIADRGLAGSASGAQAHDDGTVVEVRPLAQHIEDINDRVEGHAHSGGTDGTAVATGDLTGHTKAAHDALNIDADTVDGVEAAAFSLADGTRPFTDEVAGVTPTADASLATKGYVDSAAPLVAVKSADQTVNNSTTLQDDNELTVPVEANTSYAYQLWLLHNAGTTPDIKADLALPAGATYVMESQASDGASTVSRIINSSGLAIVSGQGADRAILFTGSIIVGGTPGDCTVRWAQNTADASDTKVLKHAHLRLFPA